MVEVFVQGRNLAKEVEEIRNSLHKKSKTQFFDVQIDCPGIILPAHKFVLSSRSNVMAAQLLTSGANKLNWTDYEDSTCIALLCWLYTDKVALDNLPVALGLLRASHHFQLVSLFETCESRILPSINQITAQQVYSVARVVGANRLMEKCLTEHGHYFLGCPPGSLQLKAEEDTQVVSSKEMKQRGSEVAKLLEDLQEELETLKKVVSGWSEYQNFADINIACDDDIWHGHVHFLGCRSEKIRNEISVSPKDHPIFYFGGLHGEENLVFMRWLYTDYVELNDVDDTLDLLQSARYYELPTLFCRCEEALVKIITITHCAKVHKIATKVNAMTLLTHCKQLISSYRIGLRSPDAPDAMEVDLEEGSNDSLSEMADCELPSEATTELLTLNDDCLLHLFHYLPLVDLGSIKDTCKRLNQLADQSFKIYREKSIDITCDSMFGDILNLKHFGKQIKSLDFRGFYGACTSYADIFEMIVKFTSDQLTSISLDFSFDDKYTDETLKLLENVLKRAEVVKLHWLDENEQIDLMLGYCRNLKELHLEGDEMDIGTLWCSNNSNIKSISLAGISDDSILQEICEELPNLECLYVEYIDNPSDKIINFGRLKHLRRLKIDAHLVNIGDALRSFTSENALEYLYVMNANITETLAEAFHKLPHLKELTFESCEEFGDYKQKILSKTLANVEKLAFIDCPTITFEEVTKIVENQLKLKQLSISSCPEIDCIDKQNYLRLKKKRNLEIVLDDTDYALSIKLIGEDLSNYVRLVAKPSM